MSDVLRIFNLFELYIHLLKYGCVVSDFDKTKDDSYIVGVTSKEGRPTERWFLLAPVKEDG